MTTYDAVMVGLLIAGMIWGAWRGITWQLASIASLVLGYLVAFPMSGQLAPRFPGEPVVARSLALMAVYAAVSGGVFLAAWLVRATLRQWRFEAFDRHLGMILGGAEGALVGVVATVFVISLAPQTRDPILTSRAGRIVGQVLNVVQPALPGEVRDVLAPFWSGSAAIAAETTTPAEAMAPTEESIPTAPAPATFRDLFEQGRSRVGRAVVEELGRQVDQLGDRDEQRDTRHR